MGLFSRAVAHFREQGTWSLSKTAVLYLLRNVFRGGLSSRPRIEHVSGILRPVYNTWFRLQYGKGTDVMSEDWDTLILLDACRYDDFSRQNMIVGSLEARLSRAADSREFVNRNFAGRDLHDTVYVTANPHYHLLDDDTFYAIVDTPISEWDSDLQCVPPESVTEAARKAHDRFADKRIIVHYMQPHDPPLGKTAEQLRTKIQLSGPAPGGTDGARPRIMEAVATGDIPVETARKAYRETIDIALEYVGDLLRTIDGRVVISADHGEMFGEQPYPIIGRLYEHYRHPRTVELCRIPWLVIEGTERREIQGDSQVVPSDGASNDVSEQLEALGYR